MARDSPLTGAALRAREAELSECWSTTRLQRDEYLVEEVRGLDVADFGCVDHPVPGSRAFGQLHAKLATSARRVVGFDIDKDGVEELRRQGHSVEACDITQLWRAAPSRKYEAIVAADIIEHLDRPGDLLRSAAALLTWRGILLLSTPNPYAPWRTRAGQLRVVWENTDHVGYCYPAGVAELARRHGFTVVRVVTVGGPTLSDLAGRIVRRLRTRIDSRETSGSLERGRILWGFPEVAAYVLRRKRGQCGETTIYTLRLTNEPMSSS